MFYYIFYPFRNHFEYLTQLFNVIIWVLQWLFLCKIPVDIFIFGCVLKPEELWSVSKTNNLDFSHFNRLDEYNLGTGIFMINEIS